MERRAYIDRETREEKREERRAKRECNIFFFH